MAIIIRSQLVNAIIAQARAAAPHECCGVLGGVADLITSRYPLPNIAATPETRYEAAPRELFRAMRAMRAMGEQLIGIYHSHLRSAAYPSATDVRLAYYSEAIYFILSLAAPEPQLAAFRICDGQITTVEYKLIKSELSDAR